MLTVGHSLAQLRSSKVYGTVEALGGDEEGAFPAPVTSFMPPFASMKMPSLVQPRAAPFVQGGLPGVRRGVLRL